MQLLIVLEALILHIGSLPIDIVTLLISPVALLSVAVALLWHVAPCVRHLRHVRDFCHGGIGAIASWWVCVMVYLRHGGLAPWRDCVVMVGMCGRDCGLPDCGIAGRWYLRHGGIAGCGIAGLACEPLQTPVDFPAFPPFPQLES